jgi:hypothetical protein
VVLPNVAGTDETAVLFEPVAGGATEVRFEGIGYGLVRLLALPLANAAIREVRVGTSSAEHRPALISVALVMEATGDRDDPRRLMLYQDVRNVKLVREPFSVRTVAERTEQTFHYITPDRRYTYRRLKTRGK